MQATVEVMNREVGVFFGLIVLGLAWLAVIVHRMMGNPLPTPELVGLLLAWVVCGFAVSAWLAVRAARLLASRTGPHDAGY